MKEDRQPAVLLLLRRREATGGRSRADLRRAIEAAVEGLVGFPASFVRGDRPGEGERPRRGRGRLRLLRPGLGGDEDEEAFPEAGGADADGAAEVSGVLLAPHLRNRSLFSCSQSLGQIRCHVWIEGVREKRKGKKLCL